MSRAILIFSALAVNKILNQTIKLGQAFAKTIRNASKIMAPTRITVFECLLILLALQKQPVTFYSMQTLTLKAHFDGERIQLDEPFALPADARLLITILPEINAGIEQPYQEGAFTTRLNVPYPVDDLAADAWDLQIEEDAKSGKLDDFYQRLQQENEGQPDISLNEVLNQKELSESSRGSSARSSQAGA